MSTEAVATDTSAAVSRDDLASMYLSEMQADEAGTGAEPARNDADANEIAAEPAEVAEAPADQTSDADGVDATDTEPETLEPDEATQQTVLDAPSGMSETDKANFAKLTPELQSWLTQTKRSADAAFTKKSQEVAAVQKHYTERFEALTGAMQQYDAILSNVMGTKIEPPDLALRENDPFAYDQQMAHYVQAKHRQEVAAEERKKNHAAFTELQKQQRQEWLAQESTRLREIAPELAESSSKGRALFQSVVDYGAKAGYSEQQIANAGALDLSILMKAMRYDAAQKAKAEVRPVAQPAPKVAKPGPSKLAVGRPSNLARAVEQVRTTGSRASLAAAYLAEIQSERR